MWGFDSPLSCIGAIGTAAVEASFAPVREAWYLPSDAAREAWYRNVGTGPGQHAAYQGGTKYHGRGLTQTTHLDGYILVQREIKRVLGIDVDLVNNPDELLKIEYAAPALAIYWDSRQLHLVSERQDWSGVRRGVFGGNDPAGATRIKYAADRLIPLARARGFL